METNTHYGAGREQGCAGCPFSLQHGLGPSGSHRARVIIRGPRLVWGGSRGQALTVSGSLQYILMEGVNQHLALVPQEWVYAR